MNAPKGTQKVANGRPNAFNGIGMNLSNAISISISCPLSFAMTDGEMGAIESTIALPFIGINGRSLCGELMDMSREGIGVGVMCHS